MSHTEPIGLAHEFNNVKEDNESRMLSLEEA